MNESSTCALCGVVSISPCVRKELDGRHQAKQERDILECSSFSGYAAAPRGPNGGLMIEKVGVDIQADLNILRRPEEVSLEFVRHFVPSFDRQSAAA